MVGMGKVWLGGWVGAVGWCGAVGVVMLWLVMETHLHSTLRCELVFTVLCLVSGFCTEQGWLR